MHKDTQNINHRSSLDSAEKRANRLKRIRNLADLSREQLCDDGTINRNTLIGWENARFGGLTKNGAKKVLAITSKKYVYCTLNWLMQGIGPEPSVIPLPHLQRSDIHPSNEEKIIESELSLFMARNNNAVNLYVSDASMLPQFQCGDVVAGKKKYASEIQAAIGYDCIVEIQNGTVLLRHLLASDKPETFVLKCMNPHTTKSNLIIPECGLCYAAPVIWHRKIDVN